VTVSNAGSGGYVALETSYGTQRNWMVTPELEDPIETLQLRIRANDYWNRDSVLSIGACNADGGGVEWIDHIHVPYSTTVYSEFVVRLNAYDGDKHHIILRSGNMRLRQVAIELGFEKIILKGGNMLAYFVSNQSSSYYNSRTFGQILEYIQRAQHKYQLVQRPNSLFVKCEKVRSVKKAVELLQEMLNLQS
jgi:hypothetical protein